MPLILTETGRLIIWRCLKNVVQGLGVTSHNVSNRDTLIVLANKLEAKTSHGSYEPFHNRKIFWENCGEDDIKFSKEHNGRMDPLLKIYKGCQLMLVFNNNVRCEEANGTTVTLISVCLKPNVIPIQIIISKLPVKAV